MNRPSSTGGGGGGFRGGLTGPVPQDLWLLLGVVLATLALRFFAGLAWLPAALELSPAVWRQGFVWQLVTYPFIGNGQPGFWFVIELAILLLFARDVYWRLGRREFWRLIVVVSAGAGAVATCVALVSSLVGADLPATTFSLLQGQRALLTILIAAFATLNARATILLFFVLPIEARWFLGLEVLFAFLGFLGTKDLAGFLGVCTGVGLSYLYLSSGGWRSSLREPWLRLQELYFRRRLKSMRRQSGLRIVEPEGRPEKRPESTPPDDPWVN